MGLQLLLILASWIVSAVFPSSPIHALIGSGGLRWFIGTFANNLASPLFFLCIQEPECGVFPRRYAKFPHGIAPAEKGQGAMPLARVQGRR